MRKSLLIFAFITDLVCLEVCFAKGANQKQEAIRFMIKEDGYNKDIMESIVAEFNGRQEHKINVVYVFGDDLKAALVKSMRKGQRPPEVALVPSDYVGTKEFNLSTLPKELIRPEFSKSILDTVRVGDKIMGLPIISGNHLMLWYNRKIISKPASSFEEMLKQKKEIESKGAKVLAFKYHEMYWFAPFFVAFGGWPLNAKNEIALDTKPMQEALSAYQYLIKEQLTSMSCDYLCVSEEFRKGQYAYAINGEWDLINAKRELGKDLGVALLPSIRGRTLVPLYSTHALAFLNGSLASPASKTLKEFALYMQSDEVQFRIFKDMGRIPAIEKVYSTDARTHDENFHIMLQQLNVAKAMPSHPNMIFAWLAMQAGAYLHYTGNANATTASKYMQDLALKLKAQQERADVETNQ